MSKAPSPPRPQRAIMDLLKRNGPASAAALGRSLGVSAMAVRQHLYALERAKLAGFREEAGGVGRPLKLWRLTPEANRFFPDAHAELAVSLVEEIRGAFGGGGLEKIVSLRSVRQIAAYRPRMPRGRDLGPKVSALARLRAAEGYMAEARADGKGGWLLIENHCPICSAAQACLGLCAAELEVFRAVLGPHVQIERIEHILAGARRCAYRIAMESR